MAVNLRVLVLGADGYLGWPVVCELVRKGHQVMGIDGGFKRSHYQDFDPQLVHNGDFSLVPIASFADRKEMLSSSHKMWNQDITEERIIENAIYVFSPDVIVHLAEISSRAFAMATGAGIVLHNNVVGTQRLLEAVRTHKPATHVVKVGSIETHRQVRDYCTVAFETTSAMLRIATSVQNLRATEIECGLIYGTRTRATGQSPTRFDYDMYFGGVVHRFIAQALSGYPITLYGKGDQRISLIHLSDIVDRIVRTVERTFISAKATVQRGHFQIIQSYGQVLQVREIARIVQRAVGRVRETKVIQMDNPRGNEERRRWSLSPEIGGERLAQLTVWEVGRIVQDIQPYLPVANFNDLKFRDPTWKRN